MPTVTYELKDKIAVLGLDDGKANALSHTLMNEVDAALTRAETEASAVVLHGRRGRFSAGFDLGEMMGGADKALAMISRGADFLLRLYALPMPLVIACTGHALAGGALLVLTGDVRVAARGAYRIGLNEVQIGLPVPILAMELARDRLRPSDLTAATLFAEIVGPERALEVGWLDALAEDDTVIEAAVKQAEKLATLPRAAYAKTKDSLRQRTIRYIRESLQEDMKRLLPSG